MKFTPVNWVGAPDRLIVLPGGVLGFVEVKAPGRRPRPLQLARHRQLAALGCVVVTLDDLGRVEDVLDMIAGGGGDENAGPG